MKLHQTPWLLASLLLIAATVSAGETSSVAESTSFPIQDFELLKVPVKIWGQDYLAFVDTGCDYTVLDQRFEPRLETPVQSSMTGTATGLISRNLYRPPEIRIIAMPGLKLPEINKLVLFELGRLSEKVGFQVDAALGVDFLSTRVLRINYDKNLMTFVSKQDQNRDGHQLKFVYEGESKVPRLRTRISDEGYASLMLDTGSSGSVDLEPAFFNRLVRKKRIIVDSEGSVVGAAGIGHVRMGLLDEIEIGSLRLRNVPVRESHLQTIGLQLLEQFETEIDFADKMVYLRPGKRFHLPARRNLSGLEQTLLQGNITVFSSRDKAAEAGIRPNDIITHINGKPSAEITLTEFRRLQTEPDTELKMTLERDSEPYNVVLALKRAPDPFPDERPELEEDPF